MPRLVKTKTSAEFTRTFGKLENEQARAMNLCTCTRSVVSWSLIANAVPMALCWWPPQSRTRTYERSSVCACARVQPRMLRSAYVCARTLPSSNVPGWHLCSAMCNGTPAECSLHTLPGRGHGHIRQGQGYVHGHAAMQVHSVGCLPNVQV